MRKVCFHSRSLTSGKTQCAPNEAGNVRVWLEQRASELARIPVLLQRVLPALRRAKATPTAPWLAWLEGHARRNPEGLFCELDEERVSFGEAWARVRVFAAVLVERGVRRGDVVALIAGNSPSYLLLVLAASYAGAAAALLNPELSGEPLTHALAAVKPRLSLIETAHQSRLAELSAPALAGTVLSFGPGALEARAEHTAAVARAARGPGRRLRAHLHLRHDRAAEAMSRAPHARALGGHDLRQRGLRISRWRQAVLRRCRCTIRARS